MFMSKVVGFGQWQVLMHSSKNIVITKHEMGACKLKINKKDVILHKQVPNPNIAHVPKKGEL